jgi:hypothetical protein
MIKTTSDGKYYVAADPTRIFASLNEAKGHEAYVRKLNNLKRPDSRSLVQMMADDSFAVPMAQQQSPTYKATWSREQRLLHSIKLTEARQQGEDDAAAARAEWFEQPTIQAGLAEARRLLDAAENDFNIDERDRVLAMQVVESFQTPGADLTKVNAMLRSLRGFEADRITAKQIAAADKMKEALAAVAAVEVSAKPSIRVPVAGESLGDRGSSLVSNLMAADAPYEQIDNVFSALDAFHKGDSAPLQAALAANGTEAAA